MSSGDISPNIYSWWKVSIKRIREKKKIVLTTYGGSKSVRSVYTMLQERNAGSGSTTYALLYISRSVGYWFNVRTRVWWIYYLCLIVRQGGLRVNQCGGIFFRSKRIKCLSTYAKHFWLLWLFLFPLHYGFRLVDCSFRVEHPWTALWRNRQ